MERKQITLNFTKGTMWIYECIKQLADARSEAGYKTDLDKEAVKILGAYLNQTMKGSSLDRTILKRGDDV